MNINNFCSNTYEGQCFDPAMPTWSSNSIPRLEDYATTSKTTTTGYLNSMEALGFIDRILLGKRYSLFLVSYIKNNLGCLIYHNYKSKLNSKIRVSPFNEPDYDYPYGISSYNQNLTSYGNYLSSYNSSNNYDINNCLR